MRVHQCSRSARVDLLNESTCGKEASWKRGHVMGLHKAWTTHSTSRLGLPQSSESSSVNSCTKTRKVVQKLVHEMARSSGRMRRAAINSATEDVVDRHSRSETQVQRSQSTGRYSPWGRWKGIGPATGRTGRAPWHERSRATSWVEPVPGAKGQAMRCARSPRRQVSEARRCIFILAKVWNSRRQCAHCVWSNKVRSEATCPWARNMCAPSPAFVRQRNPHVKHPKKEFTSIGGSWGGRGKVSAVQEMAW